MLPSFTEVKRFSFVLWLQRNIPDGPRRCVCILISWLVGIERPATNQEAGRPPLLLLLCFCFSFLFPFSSSSSSFSYFFFASFRLSSRPSPRFAYWGADWSNRSTNRSTLIFDIGRYRLQSVPISFLSFNFQVIELGEAQENSVKLGKTQYNPVQPSFTQ